MIQQTSRQAYADIKLKGLNERHEEILQALREGGEMTDREIQDYLKKSDSDEVRPRRNELARQQYGQRIEFVKKRKCRITGKMAMVWRIRESRPKQLEMFQGAA